MTRLAVVPGDGIGPEVIAQALETVTALRIGIEFDVLDHINAGTFLRTGVALSEEDFTRIAGCDAVLLGAVGDPRVITPAYARGVLLSLRSRLDLYANVRPARLLHDDLSPLRDRANRGIDCVIVRENTEGLYGGSLHRMSGAEVAIDIEVSTARGVRRIVEHAFSLARRGMCMVDKSNAVPSGGALWQRIWRETAADHPNVATYHLFADVAAMRLVADPTEFDVIVTNNSFDDILSDLAAQIAGGLGTAASANVNPDTGFCLCEPVHGSAPDITGTGTANPVGAILSAALLLEHLGYGSEAKAVRSAVDRAVAAGHRTPDLGGSLTTQQAGSAVRAEL
ncbi:isocitrate/isopropylmalate dehydrogenase family protein [Lentzea tibetensis]|uniref:Isocitrate/isopropylmalate dehydrogenase family protein n=1 Tax=Lentzea tibetensis TaxID=2591470 RepID=A0A563EFT6_9PSEU|nr:isocitrate/isopropylmalate family dehydrogenase [Lentzea tibetensis]TWP44951.1 isocitrate/isopropylmalate dehydrogenase family protein [Lentzea tibetensis]